MIIIYNKLIPFKGFRAMNLFGILFARKEFKPLSEWTINHERIHTAQQREWLYIGFFILYLIEFIAKGYGGISFEQEAYRNAYDGNYLKTRKHFQNYRS